jgi:hypothetical protein
VGPQAPQVEGRAHQIPLHFAADEGILWHQPLPSAGVGPFHTDPTGLGTADPSDDTTFSFKRDRTIPVKIRVLDKFGRDVTGDPAVAAVVAVFEDTNCDAIAEAPVAISAKGHGGPDGAMDLVLDDQGVPHLQFNLSTKDWPGPPGGCFVLEVAASVSGPCQDSQSERVLLQRH